MTHSNMLDHCLLQVSTGETDDEGLQIWEDDPDNCVELEKTECKVQEKPLPEEEDAEEESSTGTNHI